MSTTKFLATIKGMFILDGTVPDSSSGRQQEYSVRMLLNEDVNLPGVNSHTDSIPGFIHYYNSSDGIFEGQVLVEVDGVFSIRQMPNDTQLKTDHIPFKVDIDATSIWDFWPCKPNTDDYFESLPYPPPATIGLTGLAQNGKAIRASDIGLHRNVQCFLDASSRWKNTRLPSGYIRVSGRIAGFCNTIEPGHLAILIDNLAFVGEMIRTTSKVSSATTASSLSNPTTPKKRGREAWAKKASPRKGGPMKSLRPTMPSTNFIETSVPASTGNSELSNDTSVTIQQLDSSKNQSSSPTGPTELPMKARLRGKSSLPVKHSIHPSPHRARTPVPNFR